MGLILSNGRKKIELNVIGYEFPTLRESYWDNNWLVLSCRSTTRHKSIYGEFPCCMTMELRNLQTHLEQFQSGVAASVSWNGTEPNLVVTLRKHRLLKLFFDAERENHKITFRKFATEQDVQSLIDFCADSLRKYPIREYGKK